MDEITARPTRPAALPANLPRQVVGTATLNIVIILGASVLAVIVGAILLSWFDKALPDAVMVMGGVALGYLGKAISDSNGGGAGTSGGGAANG